MTIEAKRGIQSIETAHRILLAFQGASGALTLKSVASFAQMSPSAVHNYLVSLARTGLVHSDGRGLYRLGAGAVALGLAALKQHDDFDVIRAEASALSDATERGVVVGTWTDDGPVIVFKKEGVRRGPLDLRLGLMSMLFTGTGRIFSALLDVRITRALLDAEIERNALASGDLDKLLNSYRKEIAETGYLVCELPGLPGYVSLASPIWDASGAPRYTLTLIGPKAHMDADPAGAQIQTLLQSTRRASQQLGAPPETWLGPLQS